MQTLFHTSASRWFSARLVRVLARPATYIRGRTKRKCRVKRYADCGVLA